jgi:hypothetical protein
MASVRDVPCRSCGHPFGQHRRNETKLVDAGECTTVIQHGVTTATGENANLTCFCTAFVWEPYEEDPDRAWDDYKAGHTDIDGNVLER